MPDRTPLGVVVTIVTHRALPGGAPDDLLLADAFAASGVAVRFAVWDDATVRWSDTPIAIVRSTWDYHRSPRRWIEWVDHAAAATALLNPAATLRWNIDKRYLRDLAQAGIPCVPTVFVCKGDHLTLRSIMEKQGWPDVVVKPAVGASASGARRFAGDAAIAPGEKHLGGLATCGSVLVQPYLPAVETERERSLVFIDGAFAHAFTKPAFNTNAAGGTTLVPLAASPAELALATAALRASPDYALYARVDLVPADNGPLLMELELIEPDLGLRLDQTAVCRLAEACLRYLSARSQTDMAAERF